VRRRSLLGRGLAAVLLPALLACARPAQGQPVTAEPLLVRDGSLDADGRIGALRYMGGLVLSSGTVRIGGLSGLAVAPDGSSVIALADRARAYTMPLEYRPDGWLAGIGQVTMAELFGTEGERLRGDWVDSEDLARLPDGRWVVTFEMQHRLRIHAADFSGPAEELPLPEGVENPVNKGFETIAALADGRLLILAEGRQADDIPLHDGWIGGAEGWERLTYRAAADHRPVSATQLPSGDLVVLERRDPFLATIGGRLVRVPLDQVRAGAVLEGALVARLDAPTFADNYEGVAAWRDAEGRTRLLLVSDDNFMMLLRSVLVQFLLEE
jgi:hypothetical protein